MHYRLALASCLYQLCRSERVGGCPRCEGPGEMTPPEETRLRRVGEHDGDRVQDVIGQRVGLA
jgi:hypothetical protein